MAETESFPFEARIQALESGLIRLHASPWLGLIEEVGTGSWIQAMLQSVAGASATLWAGRSSYARAAQNGLYATQTRSVSQASAEAWARHNFAHLVQRAGPAASLFSLAISGAVASGLNRGDAHAWLALATAADRGWSLHLRCRRRERLAQQLSLGELGCELLIQLADAGHLKVTELGPVQRGELEIDVCQSWGASPLQTYLDAIELVQAGAAPLVLLQPAEGRLKPVRVLDPLRDRRLLLHKGSFNPVTRAHLAMVDRVLAADNGRSDYLPVLEISLQNADKGEAERLNLAHRLAMLGRLYDTPWPVALTRTPALYQTRELFQNQGQAAGVDFVCGEDLYRRVFLERYYTHLSGGITEGLDRLFGTGSRLWVCGRETDIDFPAEARALAAAHADRIRRVEMDLPVASSAIRSLLQAGDPAWREQVLPAVADYIAAEGLYL